MAGRKPPLKQLVALKRQRAEQALLSEQQELSTLKAQLQTLERSLADLDGQAAGVGANLLAHEHGYVQRLIGEIDTCRVRITGKERDVLTAREALRRVFDSEQRLGDPDGPR